MSANKKRYIELILIFVLMMTMPIIKEIYHLYFYYAGAIIFWLYLFHEALYYEKYEKKREEKLYKRWQKQKKLGFLIYVLREGIKSMFVIMVTTIAGVLLVKDINILNYTFIFSTKELLAIFFVYFFVGLLIGVAGWYGDNKMYAHICDAQNMKVK